MLEYVRASFKVIRHVLPKLSCDPCDQIVQAPAPSPCRSQAFAKAWARESADPAALNSLLLVG